MSKQLRLSNNDGSGMVVENKILQKITPLPITITPWCKLTPATEQGFSSPSKPVAITETYDGFVLHGSKNLTISAPKELAKSFSFRYLRGKLWVGIIGPQESSKQPKNVSPQCTVWTYHAYRAGQVVNDTVEFVFCGDNSTDVFEGCFMQLRDLEARVADEAGKISGLAETDLKLIDENTFKDFPFTVWTMKGELAALDVIQKRFKVRPVRAVATTKSTTSQWHQVLYGIMMGAQRRPSQEYNVLSRFWDDLIDIPGDLHFWIMIAKSFAPPTTPEAVEGKVRRAIDRLYKDKKPKFKPSSAIFEVQFVENLKGLKTSEKVFRVGTHPNGLYTLVANREAFETLVKNAKGKLLLPPLQYKHENEKEQKDAFEKAVDKITTLQKNPDKKDGKVHKEDPNGTNTTVTKDKVDATTGKKREMTQNVVMGYNSATQLMTELFDSPGGHKMVGEWLHRSARSFGGLSKGGQVLPLASTQTIYNLILGTAQTNTSMLRHEMFIKRFVNHAENKYGHGNAKMEVQTTLLQGTGQKHQHNSRGRPLWFGHFLVYFYKAVGETLPPCVQRHTFFPFSRRTPMRLEAELDLIMEKICYGWEKATIGAEDIDVQTEVSKPPLKQPVVEGSTTAMELEQVAEPSTLHDEIDVKDEGNNTGAFETEKDQKEVDIVIELEENDLVFLEADDEIADK